MLQTSRRTLGAIALGAGTLALFAGSTPADILYLYATIDGAQVVPSSTSTATGVGKMKADTDLDTLDFDITYTGLMGAETSAHIHGPAAPGMNASPLFPLPLGTPKIGTWNFPAGNEGDITGGLTYVQVHSSLFPGGEIRGQNIVTAESICWGDDSGTACPCANTGTKGTGCANSSGGGGMLEPSGSNSVTSDDMSFGGTNLLPNQPALLFVGNTALNNGDGVTFGDGLRCAGSSVKRLGVEVPDAGGAATWGPGLQPAGGWNAGDTRFFQIWYRDPSGPCGNGFNLTNALAVSFLN